MNEELNELRFRMDKNELNFRMDKMQESLHALWLRVQEQDRIIDNLRCEVDDLQQALDPDYSTPYGDDQEEIEDEQKL
jgi:hypothetical protein